ncbi:MAG TPA: signal peptidase II [Ignavibacteriaceae bacterium]|nr:signal peptidase II [Ignavibacteriaceae bacterium]
MRLLLVSAVIVFADQVSKLMVKGIPAINLAGVHPGEKIPVISNLFNITMVENPGIAFGINFGSEFKLAISLFTLAACIGLFIFLYRIRNKSFGLKFSIALILGGAVGNLIDRLFYGIFYGYAPLFYGKVVDFFNIHLFNVYLFNNTLGNYIFNIADLSVTTGMVCLLFAIRQQNKEQESNKTVMENLLVKGKE